MTEGEFWGLFTIIIIVVVAIALIFTLRKDKEKERLRRQKVEEEYQREPEYEFRQAKVVERSKVVYYAGVKMPQMVKECIVTFQVEGGEILKFQIREDIFDNIQEEQEGTLVTVNGNFFDFGDGEEI
ncbi:MAG: DUF2500 family protein [Clostridia bacterium]|nr:DUF2500 family protein [Clostridia bacterium]